MTGNLSAMMHMHDLRVAEDIGKMAELGWFDVEFTMYGCAYMFEGKMCYKISSEAKDIYDYMALGTSAHAIGTTKALELGEVQGAMSSLSIAVAGLITVVGRKAD